MSTRRKATIGSPIPRPARLTGWPIERLADEIGLDRQRALQLLRGAVQRGEVARVDSASRVLWAEVPRRNHGGDRRRSKVVHPPLLGISVDSFARESGVTRAEALQALTAARDRGEVARIRTAGRTLWARVGGGQITEASAADRRPIIRTNERNQQ